MVPHRLEGLGEDACGTDNRHKVSVTCPAGDDMLMQVLGNAGSTCFAQIDAYIKSVRIESSFQEAFCLHCGLEKADPFFWRKVLDVWDFPIRKHEEMPSVVRIAIH